MGLNKQNNDEEKNKKNVQQIGNFRQHMNEKEIQRDYETMAWTKCNASTFRVRDIGYFGKEKCKKQSEAAMYSVFAVDAFSVNQKIKIEQIIKNKQSPFHFDEFEEINRERRNRHKSKSITIAANEIHKKQKKKKTARNKSKSNALLIGRFKKKKKSKNKSMNVPLLENNALPNTNVGIPNNLILNLMIPKNNNGGFQIILYGKLSNVENEASIKLMQEFIACNDMKKRNNLKCCARIVNLSDLNFNFVTKQLIKKQNGKKFIIPTEVCSFCEDKNGKYFGIDLDLFAFSSLFAQKMRNYVLPESKSIVFDFCFLFEARNKYEVPEQIAICCRISKLNIEKLETMNNESSKSNVNDAVIEEQKKIIDTTIFDQLISNRFLIIILFMMQMNILLITIYRLLTLNDLLLLICKVFVSLTVFTQLFIVYRGS